MSNDFTEHIHTRIICQRELSVEGVKFEWWAVGERPALVTVRTPIFGSVAEFTRGDVAECAAQLAKKLLADHYARAAAVKAESSNRPGFRALKKPGWFEAGDVDFSTTVF